MVWWLGFLVVMFFDVRVTFTRVAAFLFGALNEFVMFDDARRRATDYAAWTRPRL